MDGDKPILKLVRVVWYDAEDPNKAGWLSSEEVDKFAEGINVVESVGWLKSETKLYYTLVADRWDDGDTFGRVTKIPRGFVKDITTIE